MVIYIFYKLRQKLVPGIVYQIDRVETIKKQLRKLCSIAK